MNPKKTNTADGNAEVKTKRMKLLLNIGSKDAARLGLKNTMEGETVDADDKVETALLRNGWAVVVGDEGKTGKDTVTENVGGNPGNGNPIPPAHKA